jgi:hypothetical protein
VSPYDPFEAWQRYRDEQESRQGSRRLDESINPGQLHDPKDFVQKLRELSAETSSTCAMLEQFVEAHKGDPEWRGIQADYLVSTLQNMAKNGESLAKWVGKVEARLVQQEEQEEIAAQKESAPSYGGGKLFKK